MSSLESKLSNRCSGRPGFTHLCAQITQIGHVLSFLSRFLCRPGSYGQPCVLLQASAKNMYESCDYCDATHVQIVHPTQLAGT